MIDVLADTSGVNAGLPSSKLIKINLKLKFLILNLI
jgi:hypothetical protein